MAEHPDASQKEIAEELGCSTTAIYLAMKRLKITRKKKTTRYREQDEKKVAAYQEEISAYPILKIAYVDECGMDTYLYRQYGYAARRQKVFSCASNMQIRPQALESVPADR